MPTIIRCSCLLGLAMAILLLSGSCVGAEDQVVKVDFYVTVPPDTPPGATVYLAGNLEALGAWRADGVRLRELEGGEYHAQLRLPRGRQLEYKITRGSWETVEKGPAGEELHNRQRKLEGDVVERIAVASWRDHSPTTNAAQRPPQPSTITGDVRLHEGFESRHLANRRRLLVYLPPDYDTRPDHRYPVLYMHDGQNLFDDATSFAGEWRADETAERLIRSGKIPPLIIVGIENAGGDRVDEYTPNAVLGEGGRGELYARFVVEEVKPFIDRTYRTKTDRGNTGVAGSSLGGLISLYLVKRYPDVFGQCGAVSPSLWWSLGQFLRDAQRDASWARGTRFWIDMGTAEADTPETSRQRVDEAMLLVEALKKAGLTAEKDFAWRSIEGAAHHESAWSERFDEILLYLYGPR